MTIFSKLSNDFKAIFFRQPSKNRLCLQTGENNSEFKFLIKIKRKRLLLKWQDTDGFNNLNTINFYAFTKKNR